MNKFSAKDKNDRLMKSLGFFRHPKMDSIVFNRCGRITYWENNRGIVLVTDKDKKYTLEQAVGLIINRTIYYTDKLIRENRFNLESVNIPLINFQKL